MAEEGIFRRKILGKVAYVIILHLDCNGIRGDFDLRKNIHFIGGKLV